MTEFPATQENAPAVLTPVRPMYWSVCRELWENRSIYIAPLAVAAVYLFGYLISTIGMPHRRQATMLLGEVQRRTVIERPYDIAAMALIGTAFVIGIFYCLDALHGERRDRSILFWKSLPVSDRTAVLSKMSIPMAVLPAIIFILTITLQFVMLLWTTFVLMGSGQAGTTWANYNLIRQSVILLYGLIVLVLWHAPLYGWLLLVSGWAKRATFLWAVLPFILTAMFEKIVFGTSYFGNMLKYRLFGYMPHAFVLDAHGHLNSLADLTPGGFLALPGLWVGLIVAALFLAGTVRLRRDRGPI